MAWLDNFSVKLKLALGFGLVLLLTLLITLTGWLSLAQTIERGDKLGSAARFGELTKDLRIARLQYQIKQDPATSEQMRSHLKSIDGVADSLGAALTDPADIALVGEQDATNAAYTKAADLLEQAYRDRETARTSLGSNADQAVQLIDALERRVLDDSALDDATRLTQYRQLAQLRLAVQQARFQVRGYTYSNDPSLQQSALDAVDAALANLAELSRQIGGEDADLARVAASLQGYRAAIGQFRVASEAVAAQYADMQTEGDRFLQVAQRLYQIQADKRASESVRTRALLGISAALALLIGILAAALITRQIVRPLNLTLIAAERIAAGDLSQDLQVQRNDELGLLQKSMQRMTVNLRELIGHIRDGITQIASAAEQLSAVTEQASAGVNSQKSETDQVATAMNEMAATVQEVARNAEEASLAASNADRQAREGETAVNDAVGQMDRLAAEVSRSNDAVGLLKQESERIGSVLDVIKSVAEQTNLLALNAAIEAARAGDAGRGFAVVADEVRGLAQRTQKSTEEIEELIAGLQSGTQRAASLMDSSRALTESTVELTRSAGSRLGDIARAVSTIQAMNQQIAAAAEQQGVVAEEINRSVINVRDISEQTASSSEETAASSVELARLGAELQQRVARFRT
ncbi:MAG: methyl-accepting chemotaxis protein [Pseudomonas kuykendallii]|uniref:Methyl-accepting chemotaxis protein n=2 Tax=Pseudomonas kuykendallii TaxID=1007099 RepID=A0A2W5ET41_9PSED|nr:methyl-accepting chemotaxis protein [Pseudomonas kuykendallii]PZP23246.1 MAG: methyl-accepting chemotaxis protein [Pseudomonas kuykendallii]